MVGLRFWVIPALAVLLTGCFSTLTGNEGNFSFSYIADDEVNNFNKPIAAGAKLDVMVKTVGLIGQAVALDSATTDDEMVATVDNVDGNTVTLLGVGDGSFELSVTGAASGEETLSDSVNMLVRVPDVLKLSHTCDTDDTAKYLVDQRIWVPFELELSDGQAVIGYDYYPVTFDPTAALTRDETIDAQQFLHLDTQATAGMVTIESDIDDTTLTLELVEPASIDGAEVVAGQNLIETDVGDRNVFYILPKVGDDRVCQAELAKSINVTTPDICAITEQSSETNQENAGAQNEFGWVQIEGLAAGDCEFEISYTGVSGSFPLSVEIAP